MFGNLGLGGVPDLRYADTRPAKFSLSELARSSLACVTCTRIPVAPRGVIEARVVVQGVVGA